MLLVNLADSVIFYFISYLLKSVYFLFMFYRIYFFGDGGSDFVNFLTGFDFGLGLGLLLNFFFYFDAAGAHVFDGDVLGSFAVFVYQIAIVAIERPEQYLQPADAPKMFPANVPQRQIKHQTQQKKIVLPGADDAAAFPILIYNVPALRRQYVKVPKTEQNLSE